MRFGLLRTALVLFAPFGALLLGYGCGNTDATNPFSSFGQGGFSNGPGSGGGTLDAGPDADPTLGGPCTDDGQCDDMIACTLDKCDMTLLRCRFSPDDSTCQDGVYCNGLERCDNHNGCIAGDPVGCDDKNTCTIDSCDEATQGCHHDPRDADGDGDPDAHCGGGDCDDADPTVSSKLPEICGNGKDDNCDGKKDEAGCTTPTNDTCVDPLEIKVPGVYAMSTFGAKFDYSTSCLPGPQMMIQDVVAAIHVPAGPPTDVIVKARGTNKTSLALDAQCGDPASEIACGTSNASTKGGQLAKIIGRSLGDPNQETVLPLFVTTAGPSSVNVDVELQPGTQKPTNETCGTALTIVPGAPVTASIIDAVQDLGSACVVPLGDLVYTFDLATPGDVDVFATSVDGEGYPAVSLRGSGCAMPADELACQVASSVHVTRHSLPAGTYYISVSSTVATDVDLTLEVSSPTPLDPDETCVGSPVIAPNKSIVLDLTTHEDDINIGCFPGSVDAAYELDLANASDVLLVERISAGDVCAVELADPACDAASKIICGIAGASPIRASHHAVPAGSYRVIAESLFSDPVTLTAFVRDAVPTTLVPFADGCADVQKIPSDGGFFQGNTSNAQADFNAGCDQGGLPQFGAPDQLLQLDLAAKKRVVLDMQGSGYNTLLDVRQGPSCPGMEVPQACTVGFGQSRSFLDLTLDAGTYFIQVDGFALDSGPWFLDVRVVDP